MAHTRKVARDPSVAAEAKRIASATYYQKNADIIREKRRIQMAEKRAKIKAKRRRSDKPRPPTKKQLKSVPCPRILAEAENDASDALLTMAQQPAQQPVLPPASPDLRRSENVSESNEGLDHCDIRDEIDVDAEDSDNAEAGYRTISEVAAMRCQEILIEDETAILVHGKLTPERELSIPSSLPSTSTSTAKSASVFHTGSRR
ncbi:hypothetical protein R3P38DRAFT_3164361 [Favolaschia claudopus]|uniref:Uncharacterized protein n=1 Tax=Favolaschia claudopus TaxID=2862362 RepID=A0AAW0ECY7_9AGAR